MTSNDKHSSLLWYGIIDGVISRGKGMFRFSLTNIILGSKIETYLLAGSVTKKFYEIATGC
jgi:hypothetical protein